MTISIDKCCILTFYIWETILNLLMCVCESGGGNVRVDKEEKWQEEDTEGRGISLRMIRRMKCGNRGRGKKKIKIYDNKEEKEKDKYK